MKTYLKLLALPLVAATLVIASGCRSTGGTDEPGSRTVGQKIDDSMATSRVKDALSDATTYKFNDVDVTTREGVVQLSGWVNSKEQKSAAEMIARNTPGIGGVVNNIVIRETDPDKTDRVRPPTNNKN